MLPVYLSRSLVFAACLVASACSKSTEEPDSSDAPAPAAAVEVEAATDNSLAVSEIDWFEGTVDDAFATAADSGKPVFLYWGAVWCPPCHAISATVFKSPDFIERSSLFVPVYLDGDTENAQALGERFGVRGYPTMIVFAPDGTELTRIPGGIDLQAYASVLDLTLSEASPARELVAKVEAGNATLSPANCSLLAYYSWGQDTEVFAEREAIDVFRNTLEACPADLQAERSLLYFYWLDERLAGTADSEPAPLSDAEAAEAQAMIAAVLDGADLLRTNVFAVTDGGANYVAALTAPGSAVREQLTERFYAALDQIAADNAIYKRERIYTVQGKMNFERMEDPEAMISAELKREIAAMVEWADTSTPDPYERQPIINALGNVLNDAGMDDVAKPLLLAELERSKQPYYFMVDLADIEQKAGNYDKAIDWLQQAYDQTRGPATRFQWGYYYLVGLLEMTPDDTDRIHSLTVEMIDELQRAGGFYQRPKAQLQRLQARLLDWSETHSKDDAINALRADVLSVCAATADVASRDACETFLDTA